MFLFLFGPLVLWPLPGTSRHPLVGLGTLISNTPALERLLTMPPWRYFTVVYLSLQRHMGLLSTVCYALTIFRTLVSESHNQPYSKTYD